MVEVLHEHQVAGTHPPGSSGVVQANGDLLMAEPGGATRTYPDGTWHAWGVDMTGSGQCAWRTPNPSCPRCYPPAVVVKPA